jgi:hypothetical protein
MIPHIPHSRNVIPEAKIPFHGMFIPFRPTLDRFTDDYRRYWNSLTPDMRESIEDDLYHAVLTGYGQYDDEELLDFYVAAALSQVEYEYETSRARRQLAEVNDESNSLFPRRWLDRVSARLQEVRMANVDLRQPVTELTEAQRKIVQR